MSQACDGHGRLNHKEGRGMTVYHSHGFTISLFTHVFAFTDLDIGEIEGIESVPLRTFLRVRFVCLICVWRV